MSDNHKPKVLVAEDERDIRELIGFTLRFAGLDVTLTKNGVEAVEQAPVLKPDLIMLDVRMPKMTGYEACRTLKDNPDTCQIPIVILSAKGQEGEIQEGIESGADHYIVKPFAPDDLTRRVREILRGAGALEE
ncbi:MAG TPA: response regulator [Chloroflexi bacterium]|nr:response regulator [Chloroflexota bacterium]